MCVLRAYGDEFDVDAFLAESPLEPCSVIRRGTRESSKSKRPPPDYSGFHVGVCDASWTGVSAHIEGLFAFFRKNSSELARLKSYPGLETIYVDVPVGLRLGSPDVAVQGEIFPPNLVELAGRLGVGLGISLYPALGTHKTRKP